MNVSGSRRLDLAAVLLAGGKSRRMGREKALLFLDGRPVVQILAERLSRLTDQVFISTNDPQTFTFLGLPSITDIYPGRGPLGGLHAAMTHTSRPLLLVLACDLPGASTDFLQYLIDCSADYDVVIPCTSDGRLHPVCAVYRRTCLAQVRQILEIGENRMLSLLEDPKLRVRRVAPGEGLFSEADLFDLNSPEDYAKYLRLHRP